MSEGWKVTSPFDKMVLQNDWARLTNGFLASLAFKKVIGAVLSQLGYAGFVFLLILGFLSSAHNSDYFFQVLVAFPFRV